MKKAGKRHLPSALSGNDFSQQITDRILASGIRWDFGQAWLDKPEPEFRPGFVCIGRAGGALKIVADLKDDAINWKKFPFNYPAFEECDAFEIFLCGCNEPHYYEYHVTPSNSILQLQLPAVGRRGSLRDHLMDKRQIRTEVMPIPDGWRVLASLDVLTDLNPSKRFQISFGRYDYRPVSLYPVISSTSPHTACDFHRLDQWRQLNFNEIPEV